MALHAAALATLVDWRFVDATTPETYPVTIVFVEAAETRPATGQTRGEAVARPPKDMPVEAETEPQPMTPVSPPSTETATLEAPEDPPTSPPDPEPEPSVAMAPTAPRPPSKPEREEPARQMAALSQSATGSAPASSSGVGEPTERSASFAASGLNNPAPDYPLAARRGGWEGRVVLEVLVSAEGRAAAVEVAESSGREALDREAAETVRQWRFVPEERFGRPVESTVRVPVSFRLTAD